LSDAIDKLQSALDEASVVPKERIATKPPAYAKAAKIHDKKMHSSKKQGRGGGFDF
jgi:hypothetical protein